MPDLRSQTRVATVEPPAAILPPGAAVTPELAKRLFDRQRKTVGEGVALAARRIRAAHPTAEVFAKAYGPRTLHRAIGDHDGERAGYQAGYAQCWPGATRLVEGVVIVGWDGEVWIRWTGIELPATDDLTDAVPWGPLAKP